MNTTRLPFLRTTSALPLGLLALAAALSACGGGTTNAAEGTLHALFERAWQYQLEEHPLFATAVGEHRYNARLPSVSPADLERRADYWRGVLAELEAIDLESVSAADQIHARILERQLRFFVRDHELGGWQLPINADSGFHMGFARLHRSMPLQTVSDYEDYIARLRASPVYFRQQIENLRRGLARGFSQPRRSMEGYEATIDLHVVADPAESVFWTPFANFPRAVPKSERDRLSEAGRTAIAESIVPAYRELSTFLVTEYLPATRSSFGASQMPGGREYYEEQVRWYTTLELSPEEIHEIGLGEVERIRSEMQVIVDELGFEGSLQDFFRFLRNEPRFYAGSPAELLKEAAYIAKRMDGRLPALFGTLPRLPYAVEPVPPHIAPKYTAARYVEAPHGSTEPGIYWVNTSKLSSRPLYNLEALTLHEAVPGHHLQIALAREIEGVPAFRRFADNSAFVEGWALYSEWLGLEAGFFQDPYTNFGRLTYEMWRACRLVVDTGVHALGWSRAQMIELLTDNTALSEFEIGTEVDRYITWPGQALAYKMGELKIKELRRRAEDRLAGRFDVRSFHDAVLRQGAVPLSVLEAQVDSYIEAAGTAAEGES